MCMGKNQYTSKIVDEIIRFGAFGTVITAVAVAPNLAQVLSRPLNRLGRKLDERDELRSREKEVQRVIRYMKQQGLLAGEYEHGLQLTNKGRKRLERIALDSLAVHATKVWDKKWRIIIYDIPETHRAARDAFWARLHRLGCFQLQKSTWISPFDCRQEIATLAAHHAVDPYVTYFEAINLDNQKILIARFKKNYPETQF